ncbi:hypothetical protein M422DRAFT_89347, partial [Sphaerobolus stellatus SS14]
TIVHMRKHLSLNQIVRYTGQRKRTIERILSIHHHKGRVFNSPQKPRGRPPALDTGDRLFLQGCLERANDVYLDELQEMLKQRCGKKVSVSTIWRAFSQAGFTMKKITKVACEHCAQKQAEYVQCIGSNYLSEQLVFVDESSFNQRTTYRGYGWALTGQRAVRKAFFLQGKRYSVLPAISLDGIIFVKVVEGSFNTELFTDFIEGLLHRMNPYPARNSVIIMNNCRTHKDPAIVNMILERGMCIEFLPPYSPD